MGSAGPDGTLDGSLGVIVEARELQQILLKISGEGKDSWSVRPTEGGMLKVDVEYQRAVPKRIEKEMRPRSTVEPDFFRIYR